MEWGWSDTIGLVCVIVTVVLVAWGLVSCGKHMDEQLLEQQLCLENGYNDYKRVKGIGYCTGLRDGQTVIIRAERLK